jgi:hypothetical protein
MDVKDSKWCRIVQNEAFRKYVYSVFPIVFICVVMLMCFAVDANLSSSNVAPKSSGYSVPLDRLGVRGITGSEGETPTTADHKSIEISMF